jgi:hypothetical protein
MAASALWTISYKTPVEIYTEPAFKMFALVIVGAAVLGAACGWLWSAIFSYPALRQKMRCSCCADTDQTRNHAEDIAEKDSFILHLERRGDKGHVVIVDEVTTPLV